MRSFVHWLLVGDFEVLHELAICSRCQDPFETPRGPIRYTLNTIPTMNVVVIWGKTFSRVCFNANLFEITWKISEQDFSFKKAREHLK